MQSRFYAHSGKISLFGLIGGVAAGGALAVGLGPVYAFLLVYNPSMWLGIVLPFLFSIALGFGVAFAMKKLGSRNKWVPPLMALATAGLGLAISWPTWFVVMMWREGAGMDSLFAFWPPVFLELLASTYAEGAWTIGTHGGGAAVSGPFLAFVWLCEAAIVLGAAPLVALTVAGGGVYCEGCQRWCTRVPSELRLTITSAPRVEQALLADDLNVLASEPQADAYQDTWTAVALDYCGGCGATNTLLVESVTRTRDNRGRESFSRVPVVKYLKITKDQSDWVRRTIFREVP